MAAAVVNRLCAPTLLSLQEAGLEYLLFDEKQAREIRNSMREATAPPAPPGAKELVSQASPTVRAPRPSSGNTREESDFPEPPREPLPILKAQAPEAAPDVDMWPADWRERLENTRGAPFVWTYWELGWDLCGAPDPRRRELLKALLHDLAYPAGTHCFWPLALPGQGGDGEQALAANVPVFWEGLRLLRARAVIIMGEQALRSLALGPLLPMQQVAYQGRLLVILPSPDTLIREKQRMPRLRRFLRETLSPYV